MMRTAFLLVLSALLLPVITTSVSAQDMPPDPELGDTAAPDDMGGSSGELGADASAAPEEEAPAADDGKKPISVALLVGYGLTLDDGSSVSGGDSANYYGVGFGARGGYNLGKIFLGARFVYYLGEDPVNLWELGIEGGYDVALSDSVTLRPELGLGIASVTVSIALPGILGVGTASASSSEFYLAPGASLLFDVTPSVFLGVDVRLQVILASSTVLGLPLLATGGMRF